MCVLLAVWAIGAVFFFTGTYYTTFEDHVIPGQERECLLWLAFYCVVWPISVVIILSQGVWATIKRKNGKEE